MSNERIIRLAVIIMWVNVSMTAINLFTIFR